MGGKPVDVVGVGVNSVDLVGIVPGFPPPGAPLSTLRIGRFATLVGGQMVTALATCARFGLRAAYVGATGTDENGSLVRRTLAGLDVDISHLATHDAPNRFAIVLVDERTGERVIYWDRDERLNLAESELPVEAIASCRMLHVDDADERAALAAARIARQHGVAITSDIDRVTTRTADLVDAVTVAIFSENVPLELARVRARLFDAPAAVRPEPVEGRTALAHDRPIDRRAASIVEALSALPRRPEQVFCATLGSRGAVAIDEDGRVHHAPAFRVAAVDTTGAGDVFRGAFIHGRLQGWPLDRQLRFANAAAAVSCTRLGAMAGVPALEEVERLLGSE